jgi:hypothetical protein
LALCQLHIRSLPRQQIIHAAGGKFGEEGRKCLFTPQRDAAWYHKPQFCVWISCKRSTALKASWAWDKTDHSFLIKNVPASWGRCVARVLIKSDQADALKFWHMLLPGFVKPRLLIVFTVPPTASEQ